MDLPEVGLSRISRHPRAVLHQFAEMRVILHSLTRHEPDSDLVLFGYRVILAAAYGDDDAIHRGGYNLADARSAPSRNDFSFSHTAGSITHSRLVKVPKPQSVPAITRPGSPTSETAS